jgi:hypothetical protein
LILFQKGKFSARGIGCGVGLAIVETFTRPVPSLISFDCFHTGQRQHEEQHQVVADNSPAVRLLVAL